MAQQYGHTLGELALVLALLGVLLGASAPAIGRWRDAAAVNAAREEIVAALATTRTLAITSGGARLRVDPHLDDLLIATRHRDSVEHLSLRRRHGVELHTSAGTPADVRYDALGIGRLASQTITVRRGHAVARLSVSSYGRVRRW